MNKGENKHEIHRFNIDFYVSFGNKNIVIKLKALYIVNDVFAHKH